MADVGVGHYRGKMPNEEINGKLTLAVDFFIGLVRGSRFAALPHSDGHILTGHGHWL